MRQRQNSRSILKFIIYGIFVLAFGFWISRVDTDTLFAIIQKIQPYYIPHFTVSYLLSYLFYAKKYQMLFKTVKNIRVRDLFFLTCAGSYANFVVPASGEVLKVYTLRRQHDMAVPTASMLILMEKLLSLMVLLLLLGSIVFLIDTPTPFKLSILYAGAGCFALAFTGGIVAKKKNRVQVLLDRFMAMLPVGFEKAGRVDLSALINVCRQILHRKILGRFVVFAVFKYIFDGFRLYYVLNIIGYNLGYVECLAGNIIINFVIMIPILPGAMGAFEFISVSVLHYVFLVPLEVNILEIFLERILSTVLLFALGMMSLYYLNVRIPSLDSRKRRWKTVFSKMAKGNKPGDDTDLFEDLSGANGLTKGPERVT
jgi:uncharacterized protein (TIRG00374 family)